MSKTWYPVLNYEKCIECGTCFGKCPNGVFRLEYTRPRDYSCSGCCNSEEDSI